MTRILITVFFILSGVTLLFPQDYFNGKLTEDTKWSGTVYLDGDVIIPAGVSLRIDPGTKIIMAPGTDALKKGKDKGKIDITVKGVLIASGLPQSKITFTSGSSEPMMADWYGIDIKNKNETCIMDYVIIEYAHFGLSITNSKPIIKNSEIRYNYLAGINIDLKATPIITGCAITSNDYAGIKCDYGAKPVISNCIISQNSHGIITFNQADPNLGKIVNRRAEGGNNRFFENFEYNIYNHTTSTIYAQNNNWLTTRRRDIENSIYDKNDEAQYGDVVFLPLYTEPAQPTPVVAQVELQPQEEEELPATELQQTSEPVPNQQVPSVQPETDQRTQTPPPSTTSQTPVVDKTTAEPEAEKTTSELTREVIPFKQEVAPEPEPEKTAPVKPLTAEEQIYADIFSLKKTALEYQLDNKPTQRTKQVNPEYPAMYRATGRTGRVFIKVVVGVDGKVEGANVLKVQGGEEFGRAALEAIKKCEYTIGMLKGKAVRYEKTELFDFKK